MSHSTGSLNLSNNGIKPSKIISINSNSNYPQLILMIRSVVQRTGALNQSSFMTRNAGGVDS